MELSEFRQLTADQQREVLAEMKRQSAEKIEQAMREEMVYDRLEAVLVPRIPFKKSTDLPPVRDRDEVVRELMRADTSIREIQTADGVVYRR